MQAAKTVVLRNFGTLQEQQRQRYDAKLRRELGDVVRFLEDPEVEDIVLNPDSCLWVRRIGQSFEPAGQMCAAQAASAIHTIAAWKGTTVNHERPILETEFLWMAAGLKESFRP